MEITVATGVTFLTEPVCKQAVSRLLDKIIEIETKAREFKEALDGLKSTLQTLLPIMTEIERFNELLDRGKEETAKIMEDIDKGRALVDQCTRVPKYNRCKRRKLRDKILKLNESLKQLCTAVMQATQTRDIKQTLVTVEGVDSAVRNLLSGGIEVPNLCRSVASCSPPWVQPEKLVGFEVPLGELKLEFSKSKKVLISAPPGCGKTTLAKLFCHDRKIKEKFGDNIFFIVMSKRPTLEGILQRLFHHKNYVVPEVQSNDDIVYQLEQFLLKIGNNPVLLVLDDVWPESESILSSFCQLDITNFNILATSRSTLEGFDHIYGLKPLNKEDAMTLFCNSASLKKSSETPDEVVSKIVNWCKGFPLALEVVGRSLSGEPPEIWRTREIELSKGVAIPVYTDLHNCLQSSLDALNNHKTVKECFIDLCSFPEDQPIPVTALIDMWAELYKLDELGVEAVSNLHKLSSRNLIDLVIIRKDPSGYYDQYFVTQHDLLRELAIYQSNLEPTEQKKRLTVESIADDFPQQFGGNLLSISTDENQSENQHLKAPEVEVLVLNLWAKKYTFPAFLENLKKLKVIIVNNFDLIPAELNNFELLGALPKLKRIRLEKVSIPASAFTCVKLENLQKITLYMCDVGQAFKSSNFQVSEALPKLLEINMNYCDDMEELPVEICEVTQLQKLSIINSQKLTAIPKEIGNLRKLEVLRLSDCIRLLQLPDTIGDLQNLQFLDISESPDINGFPEEIGELHSLRKIYMMGCSSHFKLPSSVSKLQNLEEVLCDEETASLWDRFEHLSTKIQQYKEDFNLYWLRHRF